jgi:rubrerythrin
MSDSGFIGIVKVFEQYCVNISLCVQRIEKTLTDVLEAVRALKPAPSGYAEGYWEKVATHQQDVANAATADVERLLAELRGAGDEIKRMGAENESLRVKVVDAMQPEVFERGCAACGKTWLMGGTAHFCPLCGAKR